MKKKTFREELEKIIDTLEDDEYWGGKSMDEVISEITSLVERLIGDDEPCVAEIDYPELGKLTINTKPMWKSAERNEFRASIKAKLKE